MQISIHVILFKRKLISNVYLEGNAVDYEYEQLESSNCAKDKYGSYSTFTQARSACDSDPTCKGVYDEDIYDRSNTYHLCPVLAALESSRKVSENFRKVVYEKRGNKYFHVLDICVKFYLLV